MPFLELPSPVVNACDKRRKPRPVIFFHKWILEQHRLFGLRRQAQGQELRNSRQNNNLSLCPVRSCSFVPGTFALNLVISIPNWSILGQVQLLRAASVS